MRCSKPIHVEDGQQCDNPPYCLHCKNGHFVTSRDCPKYKEEDKIVHMKVDNCISFPEARRLFNEENKRETIAKIIQDQLKKELATKDQLIATLQKQVATLTKEIAALKSYLKPRSYSQSPATTNTAEPVKHTPTQNPPSTATQPIGPSQKNNERESRKDSAFVSPPARKKGNRNNQPDNNNRTRSRSSKRHFEISPSDPNGNHGKRLSAQSETSTINIDE